VELSLANMGLALVAGLASILSPCVLPVVPIIVTGTEKDSAWRPVAIVLGLALAFMTMGVATSLAGAAVASKMIYIEKAAGALIILFGLLMFLDVNLFKKMSFFQRFQTQGPGSGLPGGLLVGASLGLIWIPCVGPMLSGVLALVATEGRVAQGVLLLAIYSLGFGIPMLIAAYASHWFRTRFRALQRFPLGLRLFSGGVLVLFGLYILTQGLMIIG
jgi:cytochrome c-type biogenesis protein